MPLEISIHKKCPPLVRKALADGRLSFDDLLGLVTLMLNGDSPHSVRDQLHYGYAHGGGWNPQSRWTFDEHDRAKYPGDRPMAPQLRVKILTSTGTLRAILTTYNYAYFRLEEAGVVEMARMD